MSSEDKDVDSTGCGVAGEVDTSWINEPAVSAPSGVGSGGVTRGRGDRKRRTRRRTLSPSIGKHNYMSNVDFNDPMNFPSLPSSSGGDRGLDTSESNKTSRVSAGEYEPVSPASLPVDTGNAGETSAPAGVSAPPSSSLGAAGNDADLPDPTIVADLFDIEGASPSAPTRALPLGVLGSLGNHEVVTSASSVARILAGRKKQPAGEERQALSSSTSSAVMKGRSGRRATFGGADARIFFEAENLEPILPTRPPTPAAVAAAASAAAAATAAASTTTAATRAPPPATAPDVTRSPLAGARQRQGQHLASSSKASVLPLDDKAEGERAPPPPPPPPVAKQKSRSRSSRRRSIVMPSEARPLMDNDLGDVGADASAPPAGTDSDSGGIAAAEAAPAASASEVESSRNVRGAGTRTASMRKVKTPAEELPLSSINATTCLSRSLAVQRGWAAGDETTRKDLFRAFYAAVPGSQRARRTAARLFCLTGYPLSAMAPDDARVLCEAAGDSLDWGLGETEPRLVSRPIRRETREQKRKLVLRIKPIFELMEKVSKEERLQAEAATGVVSRRASPDGFRYENRETGEAVDPNAYTGPYLRHVQAARASRLRDFAARRMVAPTLPLLEEGSGPSLADEKGASSTKVLLPPSVSSSAGPEEEAGRREREEPVSCPATEEPSTEKENLVGDGGVASEDAPSGGIADGVTAAAGEGDGGAEDNVTEVQIDLPEVTHTRPSGASAWAGGAGPETTKATVPGEQRGSGEAATTNAAASETPVAEEARVEAVAVVETREQNEDDDTAAHAGSEASIAAEAGVAKLGAEGENGVVADTPEAEDTNVAGEALSRKFLAVLGGEFKIPCSGAAVEPSSLDSPPQSYDCSPCAAANAAPESVPAWLEERGKAADRRGAAAAGTPSAPVGLETPGASCPRSDGKVLVSDAQSPHFPGSLSPVLAIDGTTRLVTASEELSVPFDDEDRGDNGRPDAIGADQDGELKTADGGEALSGATPSTQEGDPSAIAPSGGSARGAAVVEIPSRASREGCVASPPVVAEGAEQQQQEGPASGGTAPGVGRPSPRTSPAKFLSLLNASYDVGSPAAAEAAGEEGEDAAEIAALEQRLWDAIDVAMREYRDGVSLIRSRRLQISSTPSAPTTTQESSENIHRRSGDAAAVPPPSGEEARERASSMARTASEREDKEIAVAPDSTAASPAIAAVAAAVSSADGMPTPESPLLPLLQLRLSEEEEDGLFEFSSSWRGGGSGGGSSQARGGKSRRRSLAKAFSSQKPREVRKEGPAGAAPVASESEIGTSGGGGGGGEHGGSAEVVICRLCCRKACDTMLRPCEHSACGVCVEKLQVQAERSRLPFSCPWDRQSVDETCPL